MTSASADLILLKGAPGVGKSTAAKLLAHHFPSGVRIEVDTLRQMVISVDWTNQAEHRNLLKLSAKLAAGFLRSGCSPVILVDTFSGDKIDGFLAAFREECPRGRVFVAVLHAADDVLRQRIAGREGDAFRDNTIAVRINQESVHGVQPFETLLDTSNLVPTAIANAILAAIRTDRVDEAGDAPPLPLQTSLSTPNEQVRSSRQCR
jgi:predicted kinase